jgi:hypothetical protein
LGSVDSNSHDYLDRPPSVPSTFLPSYYPDSREPLLPSQQQQAQLPQPQTSGTGLRLAGSRTSSHTPAEVDRISASGPSTRTLLDGVALHSPPRPARPSTNTPTYDLSPSTYSYTPPLSLPGTIPPWIPKRKAEWNEMPFAEPSYDGGAGGAGSGSAGPSSASSSHAHFSTYPHSHSRSPSTNHPDFLGHAPSSVHTQPHANGYATSSASRSYSNPTGTSTPNSGIGGRFDGGGGGGIGGVPNPLVDPTPHSIGYPGMLYGQVPLPESALAPLPPWTGDETKVTGEDYARVSGADRGINVTWSMLMPRPWAYMNTCYRPSPTYDP